MQSQNSIIQNEGFFPSDGRWLFYRCWNNSAARGEIVAIHGIAEHCGRYRELGQSLAQQGYNFYICDITGHGRSEGKRAYIHQFEEYIVDLANFYSFLRVHRQMQTPFLLGQSMGGLLATLFAGWKHCPVKGLVLSAPLFRLKIPLSIKDKLVLQLISLFHPAFYIKSRFNPSDLSHDNEIIEEYIADTLIQKQIAGKCITEIFKAIREAFHIAPHLNVPCLILHGDQDKITDVEGSKLFFEKLSNVKDFYIVNGAYHELLNEIGRHELIGKIIDWLNVNNKR